MHYTSAFMLFRPFIVSIAITAGCQTIGVQSSDEFGDDDPRSEAPEICVSNSDCVLVASNCCDCPTFAAPESFGASCDEVECPGDNVCAPADAICDSGQCELRCSVVATTQLCDRGFVVDEAGCTRDECVGTDEATECTVAEDCVVVPADCCGCEQGGNDTAVPLGAEEEHIGGLMCDDPVCPGFSTCEGGSAGCLGGTCRYFPDAGIAPTAAFCGTLETGSCPADQRCVLNGTDFGTGIPGIGVCQPL